MPQCLARPVGTWTCLISCNISELDSPCSVDARTRVHTYTRTTQTHKLSTDLNWLPRALVLVAFLISWQAGHMVYETMFISTHFPSWRRLFWTLPINSNLHNDDDFTTLLFLLSTFHICQKRCNRYSVFVNHLCINITGANWEKCW